MSQIEIQDFSAFGSGIIDWSENGVQQPTDGSTHFEKTYDSPIKITGVEYDESMWVEPYEGGEGKRTITFNSDEIEVDKKLYIGGLVYLNGQNIIFNNATSEFYSDGSLYLTGNSTLNIVFDFTNNGLLSLAKGSFNFDTTTWSTTSQNVEFGENSSIKITTDSNGKTLIKATTLTGTITLDVDEDVEDGTTFSIEATDNNLIIENAEGYEVTSESVGNVTTYTVSIVSATKEVKELEVGGVVYPIKDEVARNTKQDNLVSGNNIKTINGTSVLGSGNLTIEGKSSLSELNDVSISSPANGQFLSYNGTNWTNTTLNALQNTATGTDSLTILGTESTAVRCVNIGYGSSTVRNGVAIGYNAKNTGSYNVSIGYNSSCSANLGYSVALGGEAKTTASYAIQIGYGTNSEANSVYMSTSNANNWKMLGSDGKIPEDRITKQTTLSSSSTDNQVPSAKCVYDLVGNIESLLATI